MRGFDGNKNCMSFRVSLIFEFQVEYSNHCTFSDDKNAISLTKIMSTKIGQNFRAQIASKTGAIKMSQ